MVFQSSLGLIPISKYAHFLNGFGSITLDIELLGDYG